VKNNSLKTFLWTYAVLGSVPILFLKFILQAAFPQADALNYTITLGLMLLAMFMSLGFVKIANFESRTQAQRIATQTETKLLLLGRANKGIISITMVAKELNLSQKEAEELLTTWVKDPARGLSLEISEDGELIYIFTSMREDILKARIEHLEVEPDEEVVRTVRHL
jgi:hypothetical protein